LTQAAVHYRAALLLAHQIENREILIFTMSRLASVALARRRFGEAAALFAAEARQRELLGLLLPPADQEEYDRELAVARAGLDDGAWDAAWARGSDWDLDQIIAFAGEESQEGAGMGGRQ
jgi:hypothetical protein